MLSAFETASVVMFLGLGLAALAVGVLARRYSKRGLSLALAGLLTMTTGATWIAATGPVIDGGGIQERDAKIAALEVEVQKFRTDVDKAPKPSDELQTSAELGRVHETLKAEAAKRAEAEATLLATDQRLQAEATRVREILADLDRSKLEVEALERQLRTSVKPTPSTKELIPATPPDQTIIREKLLGGEPRTFNARLSNRPLVPSRPGTWYVINILKDGKDWGFLDRQFVLADASALKAGIERLGNDVLQPLKEAKIPWHLMVRGTADPRRVTGPASRDVWYLPRTSDGQNDAQPQRRRVAASVENEDLPFLRAEWLREIVMSTLGGLAPGTIEILENPPQQEFRRTAELILLVEWPN